MRVFLLFLDVVIINNMKEKPTVLKVNPNDLVIGKPRADKVFWFNKAKDKGKKFPPVVAFADVRSDGKTDLLVVEGTNRVETARQRGEPVDTVIIDDPDYKIGKVPIWIMALTRVLGIKNK